LLYSTVVIVPELIREANKIRVLLIKRKIGQNYYDGDVLYEYFKYFSYIVFLDEQNRFSGFGVLSDETRKREEAKKLAVLINDWNIYSGEFPISKDAYIVKDTSRKQVIDRMNKLRYNVIAVVSTDLEYLDIIDYDTVVSQITKQVIQTDQNFLK
jgi:hypothetical protein